MVKNKTGGNKAKKFARKNMNEESTINRKIRYVKNEDEMYGIVTKMIGNGQAIVLCNDSRERLCFIRNKFSGRNKHSNLVTMGSWVIIGIRSWETTREGKLEKCDLLEIYTHQEKTTLLQESKHNLSVLQKKENMLQNVEDESFDTMISFKNDDDHNMMSSNQIQSNSIETNQDNEDFEDIDFDDI
jgi:initiation factor 1A